MPNQRDGYILYGLEDNIRNGEVPAGSLGLGI